MTQRHKCDLCRARKVKCDEKRPVCGQCQKRRRECSYPHGESNFVLEFPAQTTPEVQAQHDSRTCLNLTLRSSRPAPSGNGVFYKFMPSQPETMGTKSHGASQSDHSKTCASRSPSPDRTALMCRPTYTPVNSTTRLQQALVASLSCPDDCRYDPSFRYGSFLFAVPRRLGRNEALDAATAALLARHAEATLRQDQTVLHAPMVTTYNNAVLALRTTLDKPDQASSMETLCAILLLTFCQARFDDQFTFFWSPHALGVAQVLRILDFPSGNNLFEMSVFGPLNATLLLQSFVNPAIRLSKREYRRLGEAINSAAVSTVDVRHWHMMVRISELMARGRDAIRCSSPLDVLGQEALELEKSCEHVLTSMQARLRTLESSTPDESFDRRLHAVYQRTLGVALATSAILQTVQRTLCPDKRDRYSLASTLCHEVLQVTDEAKVYRPLGAVWTVHALICTWCVAHETGLRSSIEAALLDYQKDAMGPRVELRIDQLKLLERRLCLLE